MGPKDILQDEGGKNRIIWGNVSAHDKTLTIAHDGPVVTLFREFQSRPLPSIPTQQTARLALFSLLLHQLHMNVTTMGRLSRTG